MMKVYKFISKIEKDGTIKAVYDEALAEIKRMIMDIFKEEKVTVFLFGSRATNRASPFSDIDIGIISTNKDTDKLLALLRERIENSNIPYKVDVVNLQNTSEKFRKEALKGAKILWKN